MIRVSVVDVVRRFVGEGLSTVRNLLEAGVKEGGLDPDLDIDGGLATLVGALVYRQLILEQDLTPAMLERALDDFLARYAI